MSRRLPEGPLEAIDRGRPVTFRLDGRELSAFEGDTVGSALAANGVTITARSFKYHRPRGLLCMTGSCPNCLVDVDGVPNVRACTTPVRQDMTIGRQNAWPTVGRDIHGIIDTFSWALPAGFYYKIFHRPRWAWPLVEPFIRKQAGIGVVPEHEDHETYERINLHPDVAVVGGGPAGLAAAAEAARAGARVVLVEEARELGGHLLGSAEPAEVGEEGLGGLVGPELAARLEADARDAGVRVVAGTPAFGVFDGPLLAAANDEELYRIRARHYVFATGAVEQAAVFPNNDLPGIMLAGAVDLLVNRYRVRPGKRAVVFTADDSGVATALALHGAGASVTVVFLRPEAGMPTIQGGDRGWLGITGGHVIRRALGRRRVRGVVIGPADGPGEQRLRCDLLVLAGIHASSTNLLALAGGTIDFDERTQSFLPVELPETIHAAGAIAGARTLDAAIAQGRLAGIEAAQAVGLGRSGAAAKIGDLRRRAGASGAAVVLPPVTGAGKGKQFACLCMDVTDKELEYAVDEGFDSMELLKRYTTITMGPCQGKACMLSSERLCGKVTGRSLAETGPTTARPPWTPVAMGVLATDKLVPTKETSIHDRHADVGAEFMWAADWRRPHHYTDPAEECEAVHEGVAVIDVSTLGKFRVKGPDAVALLERLYPNRFEDLQVGRIRYGAMLNDEGVILDDGTVCRLGDDEFFVTVTTGNTAAIERWMTWWLADWGMDVQVLNVTGAYAAVNLAGPRSREVMRRLTDMDVSAEGMPYLRAAQGRVAGVPSLVLRIGFVGELGYEIHFPSAYGVYVWDRILEAGADLRIVPFGLEAQRILRLEKQHILVGQDTDAESDPHESGLAWMVKMDKPDFLGKRALVDLGGDAPKERLVGFLAEPTFIPPEGSSVVDDGRWVGRVTSARRSGVTGDVIGLAWVPARWAEEGWPFDIQNGGVTVHARVTMRPFYDPEGARLRS
ncbi:MAG: 2Fe-2S iron-sulfur cluster-binding protein [Actinomycetota bacterium]